MRKTTNGNNQVLLSIYETARAHGATSAECVKAIQDAKLTWKDAKAVKEVAFEFRLGRIAGYLNLGLREEARAILKSSSTKRTEEQQRAYRAAVSAWSYIARAAGMPNRVTGEPRKARPPQTAAKFEGSVTVFSVPTAKNYDEAAQFATRLSDMIRAFERRNPKVKLGELRPVFDTFVSEVKATVGVVRATKKAA